MASASVGSAIPELSGHEGVVARLAFPLVLGGGVALAITLIQSGVDPLLAFVAAQLPSFGSVIVLERLVPYHKEWNQSHGDILVDVTHLVTITIFGARTGIDCGAPLPPMPHLSDEQKQTLLAAAGEMGLLEARIAVA